MSATRDSTLADVRRSKADLQRELAEVRRTLDERTHERDEALRNRRCTAEWPSQPSHRIPVRGHRAKS
jgi:hypothetical protein